MTSVAILAERAGDEAEERDRLGEAVARHVPGRSPARPSCSSSISASCTARPSSPSEASVPAAPANWPTSTRGLQLLEALAVPLDHAEPDRGLVAERHGQGVLQMRAAGHHRVAVLLRQSREGRIDAARSASTSASASRICRTVARVHDVLGGGAPVHVAAGLAALLGELVHEADDRIADDVGLLLQLGEIDGVSASARVAIASAASCGMTPSRASAAASATSTST